LRKFQKYCSPSNCQILNCISENQLIFLNIRDFHGADLEFDNLGTKLDIFLAAIIVLLKNKPFISMPEKFQTWTFII